MSSDNGCGYVAATPYGRYCSGLIGRSWDLGLMFVIAIIWGSSYVLHHKCIREKYKKDFNKLVFVEVLF